MFRLKAALGGLLFPAIVGAIIFVAAGRWDLPFVWGVLVALAIFYVALMTLADQGMIRERVAPGGDDQDRFTRAASLPLLVGSWVIAGLDVGRFHWSVITPEIQLAGLIGYIVSLAALFWAMHTNPYYSSAVRVQKERGHVAIDTGPYRFVRHPGYAASIIAMLAGNIAFGSWLAVLLILGFIATYIRRMLLEDRLLQRELGGYAEYAQRVRYRLIPGLF